MKTASDQNTHIMVFDTATELLDTSAEVCHRTPGLNFSLTSSKFIGRKFDDWVHVKAALKDTWKYGVDTTNTMLDKLKKHDMPMPKKRQRVGVWSEDDGEVCPDKLLKGDDDFYRTTKRFNKHGQLAITLFAQVCVNCDVKAQDILWSGASTTAIVDMLETAGYAVELYGWAMAEGCYYGKGNSNMFTAWRVKESDQPMNIAAMVNSLSGWFFRTAVFGCEYVPINHGPVAGGMGSASPEWKIHDFMKHVEPSNQNVYSCPQATNESAAVVSAEEVLKKVIEENE